MNLYTAPITVVLADDNELFRLALKNILTTDLYLPVECLGVANNANELIALVRQYRPEIVLTGISMPEMNGIEACRIITENFPATKVIVLLAAGETDYILEICSAGASGCLPRNSTRHEITEAIRLVSMGIPYYSSSMPGLLAPIQSTTARKMAEKIELNGRELSIIRLLCKEFTNKEIAARLGQAKRTIEDYRLHIQEKIGAENMVGIAIYAILKGIVKWSDLQ